MPTTPIISVRLIACLGLLLAYSQVGLAETLCQGGGNKEIAAACSASPKADGYYVINASAEATADKSSEGELWLDVFVNDTKKGHAEAQCGDGGHCRVNVTLQTLLKGGKMYKVEAKQGNNRADTKSTRIVVREAAD
ncbi:MAG: hypothetical protein ABW110_03460 [Steroidobacteraceae bacterium]